MKTMPESEVEIAYKEYVRIDKKVEALVHSSFADFKLFGAVGAILGASPVAAYLKSEKTVPAGLKFFAFLVLFAVIAIISFRDLVKQSLIRYLLGEAEICAQALSETSGRDLAPIFNSVERWRQWQARRHLKVTQVLAVAIILPVAVLPAFALFLGEGFAGKGFAIAYLAVVVTTFVTHWQFAKRVVQVPLLEVRNKT
jgi:hypothetical protein